VISPIEVEFPDIRRWQAGNTGIPYVWSWQAAEPAAHVAITALVHGNEVCGAIALDRLLPAFVSGARRVRQGRLTMIFVNVAAYQSFNPAHPLASRCLDEDFNRLWDAATLDGPRRSRELERARELRPLIDTVDHLLDLHSMTLPAPPIALAGDTAKGLALAKALGTPEDILIDSGHAAGRRLRDYAAFGDPASPRSALLIECGQHWERAVGELALACCERFLEYFAVVESNPTPSRPLKNVARMARCKAHGAQRPRPIWEIGEGASTAQRCRWPTAVVFQRPARPPDPPQRVIEVSQVVTAGADFRWLRAAQGRETIAQAGTLIASNDGEPVLTPHDAAILIMPALKPKPGQTAVRIGRVVSA
jgi:Predicted deacylase